MNDCRIVDSFDRKDQCSGTGSNNYAVWFFFLDKIQSYFLIHFDRYASFLTANDVAADHVCDVAFSRRISSQAHVSAKFITCFIKCYLMTFFLCDKCSAKTCNTAADYHYFLSFFCRSNTLSFMSKEWVYKTAYRVSCIHVCHAALKTCDTWDHILQSFFLRF